MKINKILNIIFFMLASIFLTKKCLKIEEEYSAVFGYLFINMLYLIQ